ncbi:peptidoglycan endopeptidase [Rummeliibacillus sp. TYF005]|uniref:C40 family peptidase n=1 Tax=Rummeliibacillus sp. TYF005 TaxID=2058214 RepID=UPI000F546EFD|nr:C40 family peptidase [Rummeliibacillus sp. TYF005]RPJ96796.1 peptidoglycan endopeptidase [Rummeliibacillus sp. TYF005]
MNKKSLLTAIAASTLALTISFGHVKAAENEETASTKVENVKTTNEVEKDITKVSDSTAIKISGKYHVTASSLTLRASSSTSSKALAYIGKNKTVTAKYKKVVNGKTWFKVTVQGKTGWMSAAYLKKGAGVKKTSSEVGLSNIVSTGKKYLGTPYVYGGTTPSGFDCSGFTRYVYAKNGISLPRTSRAQRAAVKYTNNPQPGDLVFFNVGGGAITHVAIYAGNGMLVHAAGTHVQYQTMSTYWKYYVHSYGTVR